MPFSRPRLLLAWDDRRGLCARVVPHLEEMLIARAFSVDRLRIGEDPDPARLQDYRGLVLGIPVTNPARGGPGTRIERWLAEAEGLDELSTVLFSVYVLRPGEVLRATRQLVQDRGGRVVFEQAIWALRPRHQEHVLPAECMVRIR